MGTLRNRLIEQYAPLTEKFVKEIDNLNISGIPAPHIPIMGKNYEFAKYKMAFIGMETSSVLVKSISTPGTGCFLKKARIFAASARVSSFSEMSPEIAPVLVPPCPGSMTTLNFFSAERGRKERKTRIKRIFFAVLKDIIFCA